MNCFPIALVRYFQGDRTSSAAGSQPRVLQAHREKQAQRSKRNAKMKSAAPKSASSSKKNPAGKDAPTPDDSFPVVGIGASAGGLEGYTEFFQALPADTGMAFVLVQHLDPSHHSMLSEIIAKATRLPVEEVKSGARIRPNRVYVIPPNALMAIAAGVFKLTPRGKRPGQHLAVNFFMRSLAHDRKCRARLFALPLTHFATSYLCVLTFSSAFGGAVTPSCSIRVITFQSAQCSMTLPPSMREMEVPDTVQVRLVGCIPRTASLYRPLLQQKLTPPLCPIRFRRVESSS